MSGNFTGGSGNETFSGNNGNNTIIGNGGADSLLGLGGADTIRGDSTASGGGTLAGNDTLDGGLGNDVITAGPGEDSLIGGGNNDNLSGEAGNDTLVGDGGDTLAGGFGDDLFVASGPGNYMTGSAGTDTVTFSTPGTYVIAPITGGGGIPISSAYTVTGPGGTTGTLNGIENVQTNTGTVSIASIVAGGGSVYVCFAAGTRILTAEGEVAVERLEAGDLVATLAGRGSPMKPVLWVGRRRVVLAGHPNADAIAPVRIKAGALGQGAPHRDLLVSPDHCLFLDGALVPARLLVNGRNIVAERGLAEVTYYHVELESHDVLLAEGAAAESWLDCDNRAWFENAPVAQFAVAGTLAEAGSGWDATRACAPLVHGGEKLAAIRDAIAAQAAADVRRAAA
jgi:hypothetical protein